MTTFIGPQYDTLYPKNAKDTSKGHYKSRMAVIQEDQNGSNFIISYLRIVRTRVAGQCE